MLIAHRGWGKIQGKPDGEVGGAGFGGEGGGSANKAYWVLIKYL